MDIKQIPINDIKPYDKNPRKNDLAVDKVAASIKEFGFQQPNVTDKNGVIIVGHTRYKAAIKLGLTDIPVLYANNLTNEQVKAYRLSDNKTNEFSEWDIDLLVGELGELKEFNFDMQPFGFEDMQPEVVEDDFDVDKTLEKIIKPITKRGDIWQLGKHRLMCGDSTMIDDVGSLMGGVLADLIITDPPYNVNYGNIAEILNRLGRGGRHIEPILNDNMDSASFRMFLTAAFTNVFISINSGSSIYVFHADNEGYNFRGAFCDAGFKLAQSCIWVKNSMVLGRQDYQWQHEPILCGEKEDPESEWEPVIYGWSPTGGHRWHSDRKQKTVWYFDKPLKSKEHPTMKPIKLIAYPMENSSRPGDGVLDLFGGSGSTLIAAEQLNRICYMMELDEKYCDVIIQRYINLRGSDTDVFLLKNDEKLHYSKVCS
jgi:DNA modification methylase